MFRDDPKIKEKLHPSIIHLHNNTRATRMLGGAICETAKGTLDAYIMPMLNSWDFAGGAIVFQEAEEL